MRKIRLTYITGYLSPHLLPLLNAVGAHPGFELRTWFCQGDTAMRGWEHHQAPNHPHRISDRKRWTWLHPEFHLDPGVRRFIRESPSDLVIVSDYSIPTLRLAVRECNRLGIPWVMAGERPFLWFESRWRLLGGAWMRFVPMNTAQAIVGKGAWNAAIYRELVPWGTPVYSVPYYLDATSFGGSREQGEEILRRANEVGTEEGTFTFLFSGALIPRKGVTVLAEAFRRVASVEPRARLLILGDGPQRPEMESRLGESRRRVAFLGNQRYDDVPSVYRLADAFVFPTQHDGWGMVVNEAMAAGLPVITTSSCGAAHDLVRDGENGWVLDRWDVDAFAEKMLQLAHSPEEARRMGRVSRGIMERETPASGAERLHAVLEKILDRREAMGTTGGRIDVGRGPAMVSFARKRDDPRKLVGNFYDLLRREVTEGNPDLDPAEQRLLRGHYPRMRNSQTYPVSLAREIYVGRRAHPVRFLLDQTEPGLVIDAGCGFGSESFLLASLGARVVGVDLSAEQVEVARKRKPFFERAFGRELDVSFEAADLDTWRPKVTGVTLTWIASVLAALEEQDDFVARIFDVTRPGGEIMVTDMNLSNPLFLGMEWLRRNRARKGSAAFAARADFGAMIRRRGRTGARYFPLDDREGIFDDVQFFSASTLNTLMQRAGFKPRLNAWQGYVPPIVWSCLPNASEHWFSAVPVLRRIGYFYVVSGRKP
jgi:glycosyltransferase involved in cell wall biosynthesis/SAM-dependent methyltransferase